MSNNDYIRVIVGSVDSLETKESLRDKYYLSLKRDMYTSCLKYTIKIADVLKYLDDKILVTVEYIPTGSFELKGIEPIKIIFRFVETAINPYSVPDYNWRKTEIKEGKDIVGDYVVVRGDLLPVIRDIVDSDIVKRRYPGITDACIDYEKAVLFPDWNDTMGEYCSTDCRMAKEIKKANEKEESMNPMYEERVRLSKQKLDNYIKTITVNDKKRIVTVKFFGGDVQMAKCSKHDEFDQVMGVSICIAAHEAGSKEKLKKFIAERTKKKEKKKMKRFVVKGYNNWNYPIEVEVEATSVEEAEKKVKDKNFKIKLSAIESTVEIKKDQN